MVLHLHWLNKVMSGCASWVEAKMRIEAFVGGLKTLRASGYRIIWTIHNIVPHEAADPLFDAALSQEVANEVDIIHVLNKFTLEETQPYYQIDTEKLLYCPLPAYFGVYPDHLTRNEARYSLGLGGSDFVFTLFGSIQRYKGITEFLEAIDKIKARGRCLNVKVVVAGIPTDLELARELETRFAGRDDVLIVAERIDPGDVQLFLRAADCVACPYLWSLNSTVAMLALTFGRPILVPNRGGFRELAQNLPDAAWTYPPDNPSKMAEAIEQIVCAGGNASEDEIIRSLGGYTPQQVSESFFAQVRKRLDLSTARTQQALRRDFVDGRRASDGA